LFESAVVLRSLGRHPRQRLAHGAGLPLADAARRPESALAGRPHGARLRLLDHLTTQVTEWLVDHLCSSLAPPSERRRVIREFVIGATTTLSEAIIKMAGEAETARTGNGRALVVSREGAIALKMKELGIRVSITTRSECIGGNADDYDAGRRAGHQATFGRPVTGTSAVLRLKHQ
jgi:hypothetical protein